MPYDVSPIHGVESSPNLSVSVELEPQCVIPYCRDREGVEADPTDLWLSREFHIKWKRYAYIHTSWETRETLSKLGGFKRITNYIKRTNNHQVRRRA